MPKHSFVNMVEKKTFPHRFQNFWCNISQSPEERANFLRNLAPLFEVKRVIYELKNIDGSKILISKTDKKVFFVEGTELRLVSGLLPSGTMQWESFVDNDVQERYNQLMANR